VQVCLDGHSLYQTSRSVTGSAVAPTPTACTTRCMQQLLTPTQLEERQPAANMPTPICCVAYCTQLAKGGPLLDLSLLCCHSTHYTTAVMLLCLALQPLSIPNSCGCMHQQRPRWNGFFHISLFLCLSSHSLTVLQWSR
jgi:hypothetical protein